MAKYMFVVGGLDLDKKSATSPNGKQILQQYFAWMEEVKSNGTFVYTAKLNDRTGARLSMRNGDVVEGPFVETKEAVGGVFVYELESLEKATQLAKKCPALVLQNGYVEVRPLDEIPPRT
jgi:hypothetical protein